MRSQDYGRPVDGSGGESGHGMGVYGILTRHARPVLFENAGEYRFTGSGTALLLRYNNGSYVITAKHALRDYCISQLRIMVNPGTSGDVDCFPIRSAFQFRCRPDEDFEDFLVGEVMTDELDVEAQQLFFLYEPPEDCHFVVDDGNRVLVVGFPDENQAIDYDERAIYCQATIVMGCEVRQREEDLTYPLVLRSDCGLSSFRGFSGSPVFAHSRDGGIRLVGLVQRGHPSTRILRFLDIRAIVHGIDYDRSQLPPQAGSDP